LDHQKVIRDHIKVIASHFLLMGDGLKPIGIVEKVPGPCFSEPECAFACPHVRTELACDHGKVIFDHVKVIEATFSRHGGGCLGPKVQ